MVTAVVPVTTEKKRVQEAAQVMSGIEGVTEAYSNHDLDRMWSLGFEGG